MGGVPGGADWEAPQGPEDRCQGPRPGNSAEDALRQAEVLRERLAELKERIPILRKDPEPSGGKDADGAGENASNTAGEDADDAGGNDLDAVGEKEGKSTS